MPKVAKKRKIAKELTLRLTQQEVAIIQAYQRRGEPGTKTLTGAVRHMIAAHEEVIEDIDALRDALQRVNELTSEVAEVRAYAVKILEATAQQGIDFNQ